MEITAIGVDLAKNVFQVHGVDARGRPVVQRRLTRRRMYTFFAQLPQPRRVTTDLTDCAV